MRTPLERRESFEVSLKLQWKALKFPRKRSR
jgi:hypothetical protein